MAGLHTNPADMICVNLSEEYEPVKNKIKKIQKKCRTLKLLFWGGKQLKRRSYFGYSRFSVGSKSF